VRIGVAGLGGMGVVHARNALALDGVELVAVAAARPGRAEDVAAALGGVRACSYDELLAAEDVEGVVVAARSVDHARVGAAALAVGKHLLLEKPGATTLRDHAALRAAAVGSPELVVQVAYMRRYDPVFVEARRLVSVGAVGTPLAVLMTSRDMEWPEGENPRDTGGFLLDMAVHDYDTACWMLEQEPVEAFAARQAEVYPELWDMADLDNALVTVRFAGGALASTHVSRTCVYGHDIRCEIVGTDGSVLVGNAASRDGVGLLQTGDARLFPADYQARFADAYRAELAAFVAACRGEGPPGPGLDDDARAVSIGVAARASAVAGKPLEVGLDWRWP
jgi:myo-inositol 2-dehydrogenase / D-chiro-inositol 1-dehydrogenase